MALSDYFLHHRDVFAPSSPGRAKQQLRADWLSRVFDAFVAWQLKQMEREITRYFESTGGKLTDSVEREIEERFMSRGRNGLFSTRSE
ncbi:MAG: hypothetical protein JOZ94_19065 [Xanthobacteraceae bacterium]|nr:hypothetical protein [Xanthobacteraceae bacterium]MBV9631589.1 hypothetical protein [Xanthobacteraceae bacterium]